MEYNKVLQGDNLSILKNIGDCKVNLIYLDPPFFTNKKHVNSKNDKFYEFDDKWATMDQYLNFLRDRFKEMKRILTKDGSIFVHIDKSASHYVKVLLDEIFGIENFRSEIIWSYKRWSNSKKGLLNNHQVILFYSKTKEFKFNKIYTDYSVTTNLDQIFQERVRDERGKAVYKKDENGITILGGPKKGVPLGDVWEIPYLNPKAKERVGYPTQKPILLLDKIINLVTNKGDVVLDPFCGSGTALVSAKLLDRKYIGIDISKTAVELTKSRLDMPVKTNSELLIKGKDAFKVKTEAQLMILQSLDARPVQRNKGIDGFLNRFIDGKPVPIKIQEENQSIEEAIALIMNSKKAEASPQKIVVRTNDFLGFEGLNDIPNEIIVIDSLDYQLKKMH